MRAAFSSVESESRDRRRWCLVPVISAGISFKQKAKNSPKPPLKLPVSLTSLHCWLSLGTTSRGTAMSLYFISHPFRGTQGARWRAELRPGWIYKRSLGASSPLSLTFSPYAHMHAHILYGRVSLFTVTSFSVKLSKNWPVGLKVRWSTGGEGQTGKTTLLCMHFCCSGADVVRKWNPDNNHHGKAKGIECCDMHKHMSVCSFEREAILHWISFRCCGIFHFTCNVLKRTSQQRMTLAPVVLTVSGVRICQSCRWSEDNFPCETWLK